VRLSLGVDTTRADLDYAAEALMAIAEDGPRWRYRARADADEYEPTPDTRQWPMVAVPLAVDNGQGAGGETAASDVVPLPSAVADVDAPPDYIKVVPAWRDDNVDERDIWGHAPPRFPLHIFAVDGETVLGREWPLTRPYHA